MILKETILSAFNERGTLLKWLKTVEKLITEKVLVKPVNNPQSTEIVAVNSTGEQVMLEVGTGLTIDNGVLKIANVYDGTVIIEKANTIKAGTYRFKNVLSVIPYSEIDEESYVIGIYPLTFSSNGYDWGKIIFYMSLTEYYMEYSNEDESDTWLAYSSDRDNLNEGQWDEEGMQTVTIPKDITVDATFYEWFNSNTEGVSV